MDGDKLGRSDPRGSAKGRPEESLHLGWFPWMVLCWWCPQTFFRQLSVFWIHLLPLERNIYELVEQV